MPSILITLAHTIYVIFSHFSFKVLVHHPPHQPLVRDGCQLGGWLFVDLELRRRPTAWRVVVSCCIEVGIVVPQAVHQIMTGFETLGELKCVISPTISKDVAVRELMATIAPCKEPDPDSQRKGHKKFHWKVALLSG